MTPLALTAALAACVVVAVLAGRPAWAAALGAGLVLIYWGMDALTWRRARQRRGLALGLAVGGMAARLAVVLVVLFVVGVLARPVFPTTALSFLAAFTVYLGLRPLTYSAAARARERAEAR